MIPCAVNRPRCPHPHRAAAPRAVPRAVCGPCSSALAGLGPDRARWWLWRPSGGRGAGSRPRAGRGPAPAAAPCGPGRPCRAAARCRACGDPDVDQVQLGDLLDPGAGVAQQRDDRGVTDAATVGGPLLEQVPAPGCDRALGADLVGERVRVHAGVLVEPVQVGAGLPPVRRHRPGRQRRPAQVPLQRRPRRRGRHLHRGDVVHPGRFVHRGYVVHRGVRRSPRPPPAAAAAAVRPGGDPAGCKGITCPRRAGAR